MFLKTFKAVFGVGAAIVATLSLAALAIGLATLAVYLVQGPQRDMARRLDAFDAVCSQERSGPWNAFDRFDTPEAQRKPETAADQLLTGFVKACGS